MEQQSVLTNSIPEVYCVHAGIGGAQDDQESDRASRISDSLSQASELGDLRGPGGYLMVQVGFKNNPTIKVCDKQCYSRKTMHKKNTKKHVSNRSVHILKCS